LNAVSINVYFNLYDIFDKYTLRLRAWLKKAQPRALIRPQSNKNNIYNNVLPGKYL
jgi:hypothetical protein